MNRHLPGRRAVLRLEPLEDRCLLTTLPLSLADPSLNGVTGLKDSARPSLSADGQLVACEVLDLSVSGVSLKTKLRPPIGEFVLIGQMAGRIARHHDQGIGIEFVGGTPGSVTADRLQTKIASSR